MENTQLTTTGSPESAASAGPLQIPSPYVPAIAKILKLPDESIEQLVSALSSLKDAAGVLEVSEQIKESVPSIPSEDLTNIVRALYALYRVRDFTEDTPSGFLSALIEGIRAKKEFGLKPSDDLSRINDRFQRLLDITTLNSQSKAIRLQREGERLYCDAMILSDIRPVFGDDVESRPTGAVITHTLKLGYHEGGEHKEFFLVLDEEDLFSLQETIQRAQAKGETLSSLLKEISLSRLGR